MPELAGEIGPDGLEVRSSRKSTLRHPENAAVCGCVRACMLLSAECKRKRVRCRYRNGAVRPAMKAIKGESDA